MPNLRMTRARTRIFVVDDHPMIQEWLAAFLQMQPDLEVCGHASEIRQALTQILALQPDIAVVDLFLKGGSGLDLIKDLKIHCPKVAVVVLSMHEEISYAERALRAGARGYVTKRESTAKIVEAIREVRAGRIYASAEMMAGLTARIVGQGEVRPNDPLETLSDREIEVFRRLGAGQGTREIATELGLSLPTVQTYCSRIKEKLGVTTGNELVREAVRWSQTQPNP
jgi:DNA-binding NarL/FixJ family response regulator